MYVYLWSDNLRYHGYHSHSRRSESSQIEIQFTMSCRGGGIVSFHSMPIYATIHHSKIGEGISLCKYAFVPCEIRDAGWDSVCTCTCLQWGINCVTDRESWLFDDHRPPSPHPTAKKHHTTRTNSDMLHKIPTSNNPTSSYTIIVQYGAVFMQRPWSPC